jgi:HAD superfamily hydrolase (TIGR01509 family)
VKKPVAILFDIGGTLLHEDAYNLRSGVIALLRDSRFTTALRDRGEDELLAQLVGEINQVHATNSGEFTLLQWLHNCLPWAAVSELQQTELILWSHSVSMSPMPGVETVLAAHQRCGIRMGAVSNAVFSSRTLEAELQRHGLAPFLEFVISSADLGIRKPDARIFQEALARLGVVAAEAWFVGDSWESDIVGAAAVGMMPVWLTESAVSGGSKRSYLRVKGWSEFLSVFGGLG